MTITSDLLRRWGSAIRERKTTIEEPTADIARRLTLEMNAEKKRKQPEIPLSPVVTMVNNWPGTNPAVVGVASPPRSSPVCSETDDTEVLHQFFNWMCAKPRFQSKVELLHDIKRALIENAFDIDGIRTIEKSQWQRELNLPIGLFEITKREISTWKQQRRSL